MKTKIKFKDLIKREIERARYKLYLKIEDTKCKPKYKHIYWIQDNLSYLFKHLKNDVVNTSSGTRHSTIEEVEKSSKQCKEIFENYKKALNIYKFYGKVAEVGPGDSAGVALYFINDGVKHIDLLDRFYSNRDENYINNVHNKIIYDSPVLKEQYKSIEVKSEEDLKNIKRHYGKRAAGETFFKRNKGYDFIVSVAVLEHLYNPLLALKHMVKALNKGGQIIHYIDLRDHGMFSNNDHELKFLEHSRFLHRLMSYYNGQPNRILIHQYRKVLEKLNVNYEFKIYWLAGVGQIPAVTNYIDIPKDIREKSLSYVRSVRHKFDKEFKNVSDEDLSIAGFVLIVRK